MSQPIAYVVTSPHGQPTARPAHLWLTVVQTASIDNKPVLRTQNLIVALDPANG